MKLPVWTVTFDGASTSGQKQVGNGKGGCQLRLLDACLPALRLVFVAVGARRKGATIMLLHKCGTVSE